MKSMQPFYPIIEFFKVFHIILTSLDNSTNDTNSTTTNDTTSENSTAPPQQQEKAVVINIPYIDYVFSKDYDEILQYSANIILYIAIALPCVIFTVLTLCLVIYLCKAYKNKEPSATSIMPLPEDKKVTKGEAPYLDYYANNKRVPERRNVDLSTLPATTGLDFEQFTMKGNSFTRKNT